MQIAADFAERRAALSGDAIAFTDHGTGRSWSFAAINAAARQLAAHLSRYGAEARIGVLAANRAENFIALFAAQKSGTLLCPLDLRASPAELKGMADLTGLSAVIADSPRLPAASALGVPVIAMADAGGFEELNPVSRFAPLQRRAEDPWYLLFTSGTTGRPRAVIQTAAMAQAVAMNIAQGMALLPDDRSACFLPFCHTAGINLFTLPLFLWGGHSHILPKWDLAALSALLCKGALSQLFAVPAVWQQLAGAGPPVLKALADLRGCASGGAPLPESLTLRLAEQGIVLRNGYGLTESGPTGFMADRATAQRSPTAIGQALLLTESRLVPQPGLGPGCGELQLRGATVTPGYWGDAAATAAAFTADGWLRTGDLARADDTGALHLIGRSREMYISGGENIWPAEVEAALLRHPAVRDAAVLAVPDARWGEVGRAFVLLQPMPSPPAEEDLRRHCRAWLAAFKVPRDIRILDDLPRTASGKVRKHLLAGLP